MSHTPHAISPQAFLGFLRQQVPVAALSCETAPTQLFLLHRLGTMLDQPGAMDCARTLADWAWQQSPLDPRLASPLLQLDRMAPWLSSQARNAAKDVLENVHPENVRDMERLAWTEALHEEKTSTLLRLMNSVLRDKQNGPSWLDAIWTDLLLSGRRELGRAALDTFPFSPAMAPLKARLEAQWAFHSFDPAEAMDHLKPCDSAIWGLWTEYMTAELLLRSGERTKGVHRLQALWKRMDWHTNLTLKLHALVAPDTAGQDTAEVTVLIYSWNKADLLARTLESLEASELGGAGIVGLDNGSTDHTGQVLAAAQARFGPDRFQVVTLPVNVGAPAARNWLLSRPEVRARTWAAFLDDDVILPADWLSRLLQGAAARPDAGAVGCRIIAAESPHGLQSGDYHIFPDYQCDEPGPPPVPVYENCSGLDIGLFTYCRPCVSVSGCCHLISLASMADAGEFDIRYTPSQFDDLDRDIRAGLAGRSAYYAGDLAIRHVQHSSLAKAKSGSQTQLVMANKRKLDTKFDPADIRALAARNLETAWDDLTAKHTFLVDKFLPDS